jgi:hypothetical protein
MKFWKWSQENSVALVRERTIPTQGPPLVGEVSANFCGEKVSRGQRNGSPRPYSRIFRPEWSQDMSFIYLVLDRVQGRDFVNDVLSPFLYS